MKKNRLLTWVTVFVVVSTLFFVRPVKADMAPPLPPPGSSVSPGSETTMVQMVSETVEITMKPTAIGGPSNLSASYAASNVLASFTMVNQGDKTETMQARFPLMNPSGGGDEYFHYPEIKDLAVKVDLHTTPTKRITTENPGNPKDPPVAWAAFDVTFPPKQNVLIEVTYTMKAGGYYPTAEINYVFETGAGWYGSIGKADLIVRLPYPASAENYLGNGLNGQQGKFNGNEVDYHYENFEPQSQDNFQAEMILPQLWQSVLDTRKTAAAKPNDGNAWGALGRALKFTLIQAKGYIRDDDTGRKLYEEAAQAYEKALQLAPGESKWYSGYAELQWAEVFGMADPGDPRIIRIIGQLNKALKLDPDNQQAKDLLLNMSYSVPEAVGTAPGGFVMKALTATVTMRPTFSAPPTETPEPTGTLEVTPAIILPPTEVAQPSPILGSQPPSGQEQTSPEANPAPTKAGKPRLPLPCVGGVGLVIPVVFSLVWPRRRRN